MDLKLLLCIAVTTMIVAVDVRAFTVEMPKTAFMIKSTGKSTSARSSVSSDSSVDGAAAEIVEISDDEVPPPTDRDSDQMADEIAKKLNWRLKKEHSPEEAAVSASLYMNPATTKIAQHVKITWEPEVAEILKAIQKVSNPNRPFMVGIVGIPGSGKSTSSEVLAEMLMAANGESGVENAIVMPMDGYHYSLEDLAKFPDAADAVYRRGAPDTFNPVALARDLERIAYGSEPEVRIPGFDHARGDPEPDQHTFRRAEHRVIICEGIYLLHDSDGWEHVRKYFDYTIYIDADIDACITRLKERNKCIPVRIILTVIPD